MSLLTEDNNVVIKHRTSSSQSIKYFQTEYEDEDMKGPQ